MRVRSFEGIKDAGVGMIQVTVFRRPPDQAQQATAIRTTRERRMQIRRAVPNDRDVLFDVWLRSAVATHTFVSDADIEAFKLLVRDYLGSNDTEFWVLCDG